MSSKKVYQKPSSRVFSFTPSMLCSGSPEPAYYDNDETASSFSRVKGYRTRYYDDEDFEW